MENKKIVNQNDPVNSVRTQLAQNLISIQSIIDAAYHNSAFANKIELIIKLLLPILKEGSREKSQQPEIDLMVANIKYMAHLVAEAKAKNPLISDELTTLTMEAESMILRLEK